jgi:prepilin-type N-terminal cleavage/methylation domain-containing protein
MKKQSGFTLVEIAIVLVIIGLLLGGVLKGQELITQAKIKNVANDFNGLSAAIYAYQDRYKGFPGDDNGAVARWTNTADGNKDGSVGGEMSAACGAAAADESCLFWQHLRFSGLIAGDTATRSQPQNAAGGLLGVQSNAGPAAAPILSGLIICSTNLLGKIASAIDTQFDNGAPDTGTVRGFTQTGSVTPGVATNPTRAAAATAYVDDGSTLYTVCRGV